MSKSNAGTRDDRAGRKSLDITTVRNCSVNCHPLCPQMKFREAYGDAEEFLSMENFKLALSRVPKEVKIVFSGFSEPFLNGKAMDMMEHAKVEGHEIWLYSTLVGLKADEVDRLSGLVDRFIIHLPDDKGIANIPFTDNYKDTLVKVLSKLRIDGYSRMDDHFINNTRAGNSDNSRPNHIRGPFYCPDFTSPHFVMLPNCNVVLCCMDFTLRHRLGNLKHQTFDQIEHSPERDRIIRQRWKMDGDALCRTCVRAWPLGKDFLYRTYVRSKKWGAGEHE